VAVPVPALTTAVGALFEKVGVPSAAAALVAASLVEADREGLGSHGVMLVPMYVDRIRAGSVAPAGRGTVVHDAGACVTIDAGHALGQVTSEAAVALANERAAKHGLAAVAVRNGFHFGTAGYWGRRIAAAGHVGIVMSNTRPLMPPPGGAERVVGNNPIAIALPTANGPALVSDMAMSATAMGRIRLAESAGKPIPEGWAADAEGRPTTDPATAIKGMLLPAAGPKGFGLAVMIDLLCGGLAAGAVGGEVRPLYGDPADPYRCAHLFLALSPAAFGVAEAFGGRVQAFADTIRNAKPAPGVARTFAPGDVELAKRAENDATVPVPPDVLAKLVATARQAGVPETLIQPLGA
jgi:LDH2 family malate/lactate/ureidoglycolate dehydrogenase